MGANNSLTHQMKILLKVKAGNAQKKILATEVNMHKTVGKKMKM